MKIGMTGNSKSFGISLSGLFPDVFCEDKRKYFTPPHKFYIKDKAMTNHWVGDSLIKNIGFDELFNIKVIINVL